MNTLNRKVLSIFVLLFLLILLGCVNNKKKKSTESSVTEETQAISKPFFKLSLAEWSIHNMIMDKTFNPIDFADKAKEMGFEGLEYVSQLYKPLYKDSADSKAALQEVLDSLKMKSEANGLKNVGIMVDNEGDLASPDEKERLQGVGNHKKWIDAAAFLGCYYVRVNLFGSEDPTVWVQQSVKSLTDLAIYAKTKGIDVIVENHGYLSSNAPLLVEVMKGVNMHNCGVLPDFGNFCLKREGGEQGGAKCIEEYDRYGGVQQMMPYAKAVSAKSYDFDKDGNETIIDYGKMMQIVKDGGYKGYVGVEYEGTRLSEEDGINATKKLLLKVANELK
ncbi:sugar phosphate isomerase/epimerase family protein [Mariniflexile sp. HMF6888]|uniref:sugar phosphate isomerase/epimerase family protein n=1 Tax=Mariniflexile sp. HMF6888 TaxID=3373086 RepID=UPI0037A80369